MCGAIVAAWLSAILSGQSLRTLKYKLLHTMSASKLFQISLRSSTRSAHRKTTSVCHCQAAHLYFGRNMQRIDRERGTFSQSKTMRFRIACVYPSTLGKVILSADRSGKACTW